MSRPPVSPLDPRMTKLKHIVHKDKGKAAMGLLNLVLLQLLVFPQFDFKN